LNRKAKKTGKKSVFNAFSNKVTSKQLFMGLFNGGMMTNQMEAEM